MANPSPSHTHTSCRAFPVFSVPTLQTPTYIYVYIYNESVAILSISKLMVLCLILVIVLVLVLVLELILAAILSSSVLDPLIEHGTTCTELAHE